MKCYTAWLAEFLKKSVDLAPEEIAEVLTASCVVSEGIVDAFGHLDSVVAARVKSVEPLPDSKKLHRCVVEFQGREVEVVAGAPNTTAAVGRLVPYAPPETRLPLLTVGEREICGVRSVGMLCSPMELGLSAGHEGLWILEEDDWRPDESLSRLRPCSGAVIDFETTPNRPDTLSHLGLARQLAAVKGLDFIQPEPRLKPRVVDDPGVVAIEAPELCRRYVGLIVRGVRVGPSPDALARKLLTIGHRPISNIVDVTNLILHGLGQPLHAFDLERLEGGRVVIRRARPGERLLTLDGDDCELTDEMLVIADGTKPVALAGVMGGLDSGVSPATTDILIESAWFEPSSVRATANALEVHSSSSQLFSRGADPELAPKAALLAAEMIAEIAGGEVDEVLYDAYPRPWEPPVIELRRSRAESLLGFPIDNARQRSVLTSLGCVALEGDDETTRWSAPSHRPDLSREVDLIEELAQVIGYDAVPAELPPLRARRHNAPDPRRFLHAALSAAGCREVLCTDFVSGDEAARFGFEKDQLIRVRNPLDKGHPFLRPTGFIGLLEVAAHNARRGVNEGGFYEFGVSFLVGDGRPEEINRLCVVLVGERPADGWHATAREHDFFDIKGLLEALGSSLKLPPFTLEQQESTPATASLLSVGLEGRPVGHLARFSDELLAAYDLDGRPGWGLELEVDALLESRPARDIKPPPAFPPVVRDLALVVEQSVRHARLEELIRRHGGELLESVKLFDVYTGRQVGAGKRSLAYALTYRAPDRTLTDEDIEPTHQAIIEALRSELGAELRA